MELRELSSTYFVLDRENLEEMQRLETQDKMMTAAMGGVLEDVPDPASLRQVLDVGCGTGYWLMEVARTYPTIKKLVGVDISSKMLAYARMQADAQQLADRVDFRVMDALRLLEFPSGSFDLVNQRAGGSWLRTWEWKQMIVEYLRMTRSGGIIRITEPRGGIECNSPALTKLWDILLLAFYNSGRLFAPNVNGIIDELVPLMEWYGLENIQTRTDAPVYRGGTVAGQQFYKDMLHLFHVLLPFFQKWTAVPSNYEETYQQALKEMQQPDFVATWPLFTVRGIKSARMSR